MTLAISSAIYKWFDGFAPFLVGWIAVFTVLTTARIIVLKSRGVDHAQPSSVLAELAALPLTLLQSACFVKAILAGDLFSTALFLWWGPGFWATVLYIILCKVRRREPNWYPFRLVISWLCKLSYLASIIAFWLLQVPALMFVYSAWIMNDQYGMAFLSKDVDRLRRTFDDYWIIRMLYPIGLFVPFVYSTIPHAIIYRVYGSLLFLLWTAGVIYVYRSGLLRQRPDDPTLLRNMVYFARADSSKGSGSRP